MYTDSRDNILVFFIMQEQLDIVFMLWLEYEIFASKLGFNQVAGVSLIT